MPTRDAASGHGEGIAVSTAYDRSCTINRSFAERGEAIAALGALSARFDALHKRFGVTCLRPGNVFLTKEAFGLLFERYTVLPGGAPEARLVLRAEVGGAHFIAYTDLLDVGGGAK